ncbi:hypothetical protein [Microbulbifer aestuariivivens]|uniref:hypothetical protein n=1 Tax=Microbulbifer aestuariivivens TaxID=1908308 RepID=UPI0031E8C4FE
MEIHELFRASLEIHTPLIDLLKESSEDRSSTVRRVSAEILTREMDNLGIKARVFAERFASDNSHAVSERGDFALRQLNETESANAS